MSYPERSHWTTSGRHAGFNWFQRHVQVLLTTTTEDAEGGASSTTHPGGYVRFGVSRLNLDVVAEVLQRRED